MRNGNRYGSTWMMAALADRQQARAPGAKRKTDVPSLEQSRWCLVGFASRAVVCSWRERPNLFVSSWRPRVWPWLDRQRARLRLDHLRATLFFFFAKLQESASHLDFFDFFFLFARRRRRHSKLQRSGAGRSSPGSMVLPTYTHLMIHLPSLRSRGHAKMPDRSQQHHGTRH